MSANQKPESSDTNNFDEDVTDEIGEFEPTTALHDAPRQFAETVTLEFEVLDEILAANVVLNDKPAIKH